MRIGVILRAILLATLVWSFASGGVARGFAQQQPDRSPLVAVLHFGGPDDAPFYQPFRQRMSELGYSDGQNVRFELRFASGSTDQVATLSAELVRLQPDVIVSCCGTPQLLALEQATNTIPIVFVGTANPAQTGLVASLERPGGNITGVQLLSVELAPKRLELLKEAVPSVQRVGLLWNAANPADQPELAQAEAAAQRLGVDVVRLPVQSGDELDGAFESANSSLVDAIDVLSDPVLALSASRITRLATQHQLPAVYGVQNFRDAGGLMYYGQNVSNDLPKAAEYVDRILRGASPAELPIVAPTQFDFIVSAAAAQAIGLTLPSSIIAQATVADR
jgi:putative ABC transport system substrate-binding protein